MIERLLDTEKWMRPIPVPLPVMEVSVIKEEETEAVQMQPIGAVTANEPVPPDAANILLVSRNTALHGAGCWVTRYGCPAREIVAVRVRLSGFGATWNSANCVPPPGFGVVLSVIHEGKPDADHVQPERVAIRTDSVPPEEENVRLVLLSV